MWYLFPSEDRVTVAALEFSSAEAYSMNNSTGIVCFAKHSTCILFKMVCSCLSSITYAVSSVIAMISMYCTVTTVY